jgi:hypothetical protein
MRVALAVLLIASCGPTTVPCPVAPAEPRAAFPAHPGFTVRPCVDPSSRGTDYVVEHSGSRPTTNADVELFNKRHAHALISDGISWVGIGGCCTDEAPRACLVVAAEADTVGATTLLATIDRLLTDDGMAELSLPIKVLLAGPRRPRCLASDPACGPVSYNHQCVKPDSQSRSRATIGEVDTDPRNTCVADGDCMTNGCGSQCTSYRQGAQSGTCEDSGTLESALCGCVQSRCSWFE